MQRMFVLISILTLALFGAVVAGAQEPPTQPQQGPPPGQGPGQRGGGGQGRFQLPSFADLDKNHDKKISRDEFPSTLPQQMFDRLDENHDGFISEEEWSRARGRMMGGGGPRTGEALVKLLDTDKDGKVSRDEFAKIVAIFDALDQNHDGSLSAEELNGFFRAVNETQVKATGGVDTNGAFAKFDKNKDGKLTPDEVGDERMFRNLDLNKDGVVTRDEFDLAVKQMAERSKNQAAAPPKKP